MEAMAKIFLRGLVTIALICGGSGVVSAADERQNDISGVVNAPLEPNSGKARAETIVEGLEHPWALAFLPNDEGILITERPGRLRIWRNGELAPPIEGVPDVYARSQGGLLDVVLAPDFNESQRIYQDTLSRMIAGEPAQRLAWAAYLPITVGWTTSKSYSGKRLSFRPALTSVCAWFLTGTATYSLPWARTISDRHRRIWISTKGRLCACIQMAASPRTIRL